MKVLRRIALILTAAGMLAACNLPVSPTAVTNPGTQKTAPSGGQAVALGEEEGRARQAVVELLAAIKSDPSGQSAAQYLAPEMLQNLGGEAGLAALLGAQNGLPDYQLAAVSFSADALHATVDATLLFEQPANVRFQLVKDGGIWKVEGINALQGGAGYPATPEEVVQAFLTAYQESPDIMARYLSQSRLRELPGGGAVGLLGINGELGGMMIDSAAVSLNPPSASIGVTIQSGGANTTRMFTLIQEAGQWKIQTIE